MPPCDTIQVVQISDELKNVDINLLKKALESMGFQVALSKAGTTLTFRGVYEGQSYSGSYNNGKLTQMTNIYAPKLDINSVKVAYSHAVVQKSALSYGWKLVKSGKHSYIAQKG